MTDPKITRTLHPDGKFDCERMPTRFDDEPAMTPKYPYGPPVWTDKGLKFLVNNGLNDATNA